MSDVKYEYGCEITSTSECPLREEIRAGAIDEFVKYALTMPTVEKEDGEIRPMWLEEMAIKLKEQNK